MMEQFRRFEILAVVVAIAIPAPARDRNGSASGERWIPTWVTAPQSPRASITVPSPAGTSAQPAQQANASRPPAGITAFNDQTVRMIVRASIPGHRIRVHLANYYGERPVTIGATHVALRSKDSGIASGSDRALTFSGKPSFTIPPGARIISDPVDLDVPRSGDLVVSVYSPGDTGPASYHSVGLHTAYIVKGDATGRTSLENAQTSQSYFWLTSVDVMAPANTFTVVTLGDSITDGTRSTPDTNSTWPSFLARRLSSNPATSHVAVLNEGISANRVLRGGLGDAALARFDRDVLLQPNVKWVTVLEGINDIGAGIGEAFVFGPRPDAPASEVVTPDDLIGAYRQLIERAHNHGIKVIGGTLLPFEGAGYYTQHGNETRQTVNQWIRSSNAYDAVVDFDTLTKDPANPNRIKAEFDSGDHLHPNDTGYKAMAEAINLSLFDARKTSAKR
jgi:lysophospholipase L1-like esterase